MQAKESGYNSGVACHVLCGGASINETSFTDFQRLIVVWQTRRAYTMDSWSDSLARSKSIPIVSESQYNNEDQWCFSKGLKKVGLAVDYRKEIESYLPGIVSQKDLAQPTGDMTLRYSSSRFQLFSDTSKDILWFHHYVEEVYDEIKTKLGHEPNR